MRSRGVCREIALEVALSFAVAKATKHLQASHKLAPSNSETAQSTYRKRSLQNLPCNPPYIPLYGSRRLPLEVPASDFATKAALQVSAHD